LISILAEFEARRLRHKKRTSQIINY